MDHWDSDSRFGFEGAAAGGTVPASTPSGQASSTLQPATNALHAIIDPRGSAIFWVAVFAALGLAMVSGQLAVSAKLRTRAGKGK